MFFPLPGKDYNTWDVILGDPDNYPAAEALPKDPLMIESVEPRTGTNPITGDVLVTSAQPLANKINGHEQSIPQRDDLQAACIFPLFMERDCGAGLEVSCDCADPLITQLANDGGPSTPQECQQSLDQPGHDLCACQYTPPDQSIDADGWCYVDAQSNIGNPEIVASCPATEQRILRFVGEGAPRSGSTVFITCSIDTVGEPPAGCASAE